jgi:hypothetical protein
MTCKQAGGIMAEESKQVLLSGGREVGVALVSGADEFLVAVLGGAPAKTGVAALRVVKNAAGQPFVAVIIANKHVGFLSHSDAEDLFPILAECDLRDVLAQAKARVSASADGPGKPVVKLSLAEPGQLLGSMKAEISPSPVELPAEDPVAQPMPNKYCIKCGKDLPAEAKFCLECGTPAVAVPVPAEKPAVPTQVMPVAPRVAPLSGPVAPSAQFSAAPTKGRGWWGRRSAVQKVGVIAGAVVLLAIVASIAAMAGGRDGGAVISSATTAATATTATSGEPTTATTAAPTATTEAPTTTTLSDFYTTYTGTGSKIVNLGASPGDVDFILHLTTKATAEVKMFHASGEETYSLLENRFSLGSDVKSYDGRVLADSEIAKIQINTEGAWTLEVQPLSAATQLNTPGTVKGNFEDVIELTGNPSSLSISGNPKDIFANFVVHHLQEGDFFPSVLVNELGKYEGVVVVAGDGLVTVTASFPWTISSEK